MGRKRAVNGDWEGDNMKNRRQTERKEREIGVMKRNIKRIRSVEFLVYFPIYKRTLKAGCP